MTLIQVNHNALNKRHTVDCPWGIYISTFICPACGIKHTNAQYPDKYCNPTCLNRGNNLRKRYGITNLEVKQLYVNQNGKCKICKSLGSIPELPQTHPLPKFHIDHCHTSGAVRGLLCKHCNLGLGHFADNLYSLLNGLWYLAHVPITFRLWNSINKLSLYLRILS